MKWILCLLLVICTPVVWAQGLPQGAQAPDFSAPDQTGQPRTLKSLAGPKGLVLVFFRSADW